MLTDTRLCHLCEQMQVPLSSFFCEKCFTIIKVGKLVQLLPLGTYLYHSKADVWQVYENKESHWNHNPYLAPYSRDIVRALEEALEVAGVKFLD